MKDYYAILGIVPTAEDVVIRAAYKALAQRYHPDRSENPAEANSKMSEINEAHSVLSDVEQRKKYDEQRVDEDDEFSSNIHENGAPFTGEPIPEIPEIPVSNFKCPIVFTKPQIDLQKAKELFSSELAKDKRILPKGVSIESVVDRTRPILVPHWIFEGSGSGDWIATGTVASDNWVNCKKCGGKGTVGGGKNRERCPICRGKGQVNNQKVKKTNEKGQAEVSVNEFLPNCDIGAEIKLDSYPSPHPINVSIAELSHWRCVNPVSTDHDSAEGYLKLRIDADLKKKARSSFALHNYDGVDDLHFNYDTMEKSINVKAWLYPAYVCWYEIKGKNYFAICDAVTGTVALPKKTTLFTLVWNFFNKSVYVLSRLTARLGSFVKKSLYALFGLLVIVGVIGAMNTPNAPEKQTIPAEKEQTTQPSAAQNPVATPVQAKNEGQSDSQNVAAHSAELPLAKDGVQELFSGSYGGSQKIEMTLTRSGDNLSGSYVTNLVGKPAQLSGKIDINGVIDLVEMQNGGVNGRFHGQLTGHSFEGQWNPVGSEAPIEFLIKSRRS